jgi:transcriptional regulator
MHPDPCFHPQDRAQSLAKCRTLVELRAQIAALVATSEARVPGGGWTLDEATPADVDAMIPHIVGFELELQDWRSTSKLSQNKPAPERERVASGLDAAGGFEMASWMRSRSE